ncbi:hypothetical protein [Krasilnikovia sp. MM14-A1259]|uniref:hypothetical protein n=1 Tax=Krasilnikovia sp. MM14-A1259 TaxID=3373539 RepID=UPI0038034535
MSDPASPSGWHRPAGSWGSGTVTALGVPPPKPPPPAAPPESPDPDGPGRRRRQLVLFGGVAAGILAVGLTVILVLALSSDGDPFGRRAAKPTDVRPPLAQACPAPTAPPSAGPAPAPATPVSGPRTVDKDAGISYRAYGAPWQRWDEVWRAGTLQVPYRVGQHFVTEDYPGGQYHASILSAAVPAADNDAVTLNLECVGRQVAADVRAGYYPQPNTKDLLRDELTTLGGRPAWVSEFRLHFHQAGLSATDELSAVAIIDVGRPAAAVLYVSIPGTHRQYDHVIDEVLASVRPL